MVAQELYCSERFLLSRELAKDATMWFIISARHGLVAPETFLEPYDTSLSSLNDRKKREWHRELVKALRQHLTPKTRLLALGDAEYFSSILTFCKKHRQRIYVPFSHVPTEKWICWLKMAQKSSKRRMDIEAFYLLLAELENGLGGMRCFGKCTGALDWPDRGLYLFFDHEETRLFDPTAQRVIRVGTHAVSEGSKSTLWQRLKTHRGNEDGSGSHRGSIFRCHIGTAILNQRQNRIPTWGDIASANSEARASEAKMELEVSSYLAKLNLLWIDIGDGPSKFSDRAYLEQNIIALLSGPDGPLDVGEENWLGYSCPNMAVQRSGLWNVNYTDFEYDPHFLDVFKFYIDVTLGRQQPPKKSIAHKTWYEAVQSGYRQKFLNINP